MDDENIKNSILKSNSKRSLKNKNNEELTDAKKEKRLSIINPKYLKNNNMDKKLKKENKDDNKGYSIKEKKTLTINQIKCKSSLKILHENFLFYKIEKRKKYIKTIYNFSYSKLFSKYYNTMKNHIKIIQKYINNYLNIQQILNKQLSKYLENYSKNANEIDKQINSILFPYRKKIINKEKINKDKDKNIKNDLIENKKKDLIENKDINNGKSKKNLSSYEKYKNYKKINKLYEYSDNNKINLEKNNNNDENSQENENLKSRNNDSNLKNMNNSANSAEEKEEEYNITYKLIKEIPNLSIKNNGNLINNLYSSNYDNQTNEKEQYYNNKLYFLSKIIDIDILTELSDEDEYNQILWVQEYKKIYEFNLINKTPIQQIYLGDRHTLLINNMGNIFLFGYNEKRQCGFMNGNDSNEESKSVDLNFIYSDISLSLYQYFNNLYGNIQEAILGDEYTLLLNNQGKVYSFGNYLNFSPFNNSKNFDNNLSFANGSNMQNVKRIQGNGNLNIYLKKNNDLFIDFIPNKIINPNNNNTKNIFNHQTSPFQIFLDKNIKIASISCGYNFYILLSKEGKLYSGGSNIHGELCISDDDDNQNSHLNPTEIYEVSKLNEKIIQVSCGFKHVVILTSNNNVYGWGNNSYGQLFSNEIYRKNGIIKMNNEDKNKIIQISAGFRSSFVLNDNNEIYYFGFLNRNKKNMTGIGEQIFIEEKNNEFGNKSHFVPVKINSRWNKLFSIFYVTFADIRNFSIKIEYINKKNENQNIKKILKNISTKWLSDSVKLPYIQEISQYINYDYIEKPNKVINKVYN